MLKTSTGLILKTLKYGETSVILDIFSPDSGIQSYIIGGVRKKKASTKASLTAVLNFVRFVYYDNKSNSLKRVREIQFEHVYQSIPFDIIKSSLGLFLAEVLKKSLRGSDSNETIFGFVKEQFLALDGMSAPSANFHISFLLDLSALLGFAIHNNFDETRPYFNLEDGSFTSFRGDIRYILMQGPSASLSGFLSGIEPPLNKEQRLELLQHLVNFYRYHIDGFGQLKSLDILTSLYA